jgi:hypothetical protein
LPRQQADIGAIPALRSTKEKSRDKPRLLPITITITITMLRSLPQFKPRNSLEKRDLIDSDLRIACLSSVHFSFQNS